ncbi:hypothetical protein ILYODFUR_010954 [Ilyodon furcidens]|uniref:Tower domain-containing protein n=1 Tax=Ilyodon furcidens TaxID=33524 RepID=A0ABV0VEJ5_9TELE
MTLQGNTDSVQLPRPSSNITDSGFIRKKRKFVYIVAATKSQVESQDSEFQKTGPSPKPSDSEQEVNTESLQVTPAKAECRRTENQRKLVGETITSFVGTKRQDIDMSQLCRDFAQEFNQMPDLKIADDTQSNFSPAACLSAMKQAKQKAKQENFPNAYSSICNNKHMPTSCQPCSIGEGTMFDSGFQTGVADITHMTSLSFGLPHLENFGQSRPLLGFKTDEHHFPSTNGSGKLKVTELPRQRSSKGQTPDHGKEIQLHIESTSTRQSWCREKTADDSKCGQPERTPVSLPSSNASGFKTASNKGIRISLANLERAKRLFEETEDKKTFCDHGTKTNHAINVNSNFSPETMKNSPTNSNPPPYDGKSFKHISSQLTASEKADVTELCTLLEEADSQFEFTQYKPAKNIQNHQDEKQDSGSDSGKHPDVTVMNEKIPSVVENRTNGMNKYTEMSVSASLDSLSEDISEDRKCLKLGEPNILPGTKDTSELENNSTVMHGEAFRTAEGNVLKVSKTCLSKARALFADLENNLTDQKPSVKQNKENAAKTEQKCNVGSDMCKKDSAFNLKESCDVGNNFENCFSKLGGVVCSSKHVIIFGDEHDTKSLKKNEADKIMCESGFRMASGKGISISARFMQEADAFFKDCKVMGHEEDENIKAPQPPPESAVIKKSFSNLKSQQVSISKERGAGYTKLDDVNAGLIAHHTKGPHLDEVEMDSKFTPALKNEDGKPSSTSKPFSMLRTSKSIDSSAFEELCPGDGFCTATGKNIFVSAAAMRKAESLLNQIHTPEEINNQPNQKEKTTKCHESSKIDNGGFQTVSGTKSAISSAALKKGGFFAASGKPVVLSSEAWEKAKALFSDISLKMDNVSETALARRDKKHEKDQSNAEIINNRDFTTAGGVKDHVSQKSLLKVKDHLKEFDNLVLAKAMQDEDALFTDCDLGSNSAMLDSVSKKEHLEKPFPGQRVRINISEEVGKGCFRDTEQQKENILPQVSYGFKTASGGRVDVSFEALKRAETLLGECVGVEEKRNAAPPESKEITLPLRNGGFQSASGKSVLPSSESLGKAKSLFSDISLGAEDPNISQTRISSKNQDSTKNTEKICCGFTTARGEKVDVLQKNLQKAKVLFKELDDLVLTKEVQDEDAFFADCDVGINNEMLGKDTKCKVNVGGSKRATAEKCYPDDKMRSNISMEAGCSRDLDKQVEQREDILPQAGREFQTASEKRFAVLSEALKSAETVLGEFEGIEDKTNAILSQFKATAPPLRNGGFHSASGKPIALSTEAVEKAKSFFGNITFSAEDPDFSQTKRTDGKLGSQNKTEKICCRFTTARGEKVDVSQKNLQKAKFLFKELDDLALTKAMQDADDVFKEEEGWTLEGNCEILSEQTNKIPVNESGSIKGNMSKPNERETGSICEEPKNGSIKAKQNKGSSLPALNGGFQTASGKTVAVSCEALSKAKLLLSENKADEDRTCVSLPLSEPPVTDPGLINGGFFAASGKPVAFSSKALQKAKTFFGDISLNAALPHTETQHRFFAQEALDCTKALLEDEVLVGRTLLTTAEHFQLPEDQESNGKSIEDDKRRKRRSAEDVTAQPPSKRRLLEEFARTTDGPRSSGLHPVKSCPNGLMDRGVFKYSASHHPNVTRPHNFVDARLQRSTQTHHSDPGGGRSAPFKMPAFVPPFIKNSKRDIPKNPEAEDRKRAPAFVPPFKKQRVVLQGGSLDQQEANKQHHSLLLESNSNKDAPLTENSHSSTDAIPLVNSSATDTVINQSVPVNVGPVSSTEMLPVDDRLSRSQDMTQNIELARDMQDMRIRKKKRQTIRPLPGSLFLTKTSGVERIPLKVALNGRNPGRYSAQELYEWGVHKHVPEITCGNAESFRFNLLQFVKQESLADGDPKLISQQWVYNHYKWIVWKQASMEKSFPETIGSLCLTPDQVLLQLKYRYDVEVDHSHRPALRKIMERDDTPAKTLVLCVCEIVSRGHSLNVHSRSYTKTPKSAETKVETQFAVIQLTDGWYAIKAQLDEPLTAMLHKGRLAVGGKLIIHGAQLVGSQDACSPLEAPDSLMLKICANSTRRARWDTKLGFHRDPRPFLLPISCLYSNGGPVGCVDIIILRSYPIQWMERKSDGGVVFRSARAEEKEARLFNSHKQKAIEMLFAKVQAEFEKEEEGSITLQRRRQTISKQDIENLQDGEELYEAVGDDPADLETHLNEQQLETLRAYRCSLMEKKQAELQDRYRRALEAEDNEKSCPKRDVTPVWRLCIADSRVQSSCVYQLNLWRPSSDLQSLLKEGCRFKVYNLVASDGKKRSSVETVQLTGTKKTQFQELQESQEWLSSRFQQRVSTNFVDLQNEEFKPLCGDVDLIGYVISVIDQQGSSPAFYLVDGKLNFVKVRCFCSLSQAGLEDVLKPRVLLALSNLQLRGQSIYPTPVVYAGDLTAFSTNPKEIHLQESLYQLKNLVQCQDNFFLTAEEKLAHIVKSDGMNSVCSPSLQPQTPVSAKDRRQDSKTSVTFQKPVRSLGSFTPVSSNLPAATSSAEKDPKSLKRKRALDYLSRIPSPPPISPLGSVVSPCVNKTFNPPRRSGTPSTLKPVQTAAPKPADSLVEDEWVNDEELAMIDTQALHVGSLF